MKHIADCKSLGLDSFFCEICVLAKFHRLPFHKSSIPTKFPFQLVHIDLWGPYRTANITGEHFFLTLVDDFSRSTWTQLLHSKNQVAPTLIHFYRMVQTQFITNVLMFRTDNGTEFINSTCLDFFKPKGVLLQRSMVKTPQQNGVAERKHIHLLDTARAIRFQAGFPKKFWGECILSATHLINLMPMENLQWKSPFEILYGKQPQLHDLRTIGCLCYAHNVGEKDKFAPRATKCVLLGYTFVQTI